MDVKNVKIGEVLTKLLAERNISIYRLSKDLGISRHTLDEWVRNVRVPRNPVIVKMVANYFGVSLDFLYFGIPDHYETNETLKELRGKLERHILNEEYEQCIVIRNRIKELEAITLTKAS